MIRTPWFCLAAAAILSGTAVAQAPDPAVLAAEAERVAVVNKVRPSVVAIFAKGGNGGGSGVLIDPEGFALTNFHVVQGAGPTMVCGLPDGILYDAVLVGLDKVGDVALIKLLPKVPGKPFPVAVMGDSDTVRAGDWSLAMGNPFLLATDFTPTVTYGLVSGVHRYQYPAGTLLEYTDCIQIDTSINPGNSGGPLFNLKGELIGINGRGSFEKRGRVNSGVGYAISINQIKNFLGHLYAGIDTDHATLGAEVKTESGDLDLSRMVVSDVLDDSDVGRRGLEVGDELVAFAGRPVTSVNQYKNVLGIYPKEWRLPLTFRRNNEKKEVLVRLMGLLPRTVDGQPPMQPQPRPRPGPGGPPAKPAFDPNSPAGKLYKAKPGFANYYFNEQAQQKLLTTFRNHGDFSSVAGDWAVAGEATVKQDNGRRRPAAFKIVDQKDGDKDIKTLVQLSLGGLEYTLDPLKANQDVRDLQDPPGSGGLMIALYQYRRLLTQGAKGFEGGFSHGGHEPIYPRPLGTATPPKSLKDLRVDAEVLKTEHAAVPAKWFFSLKDRSLIGFEVTVAKDEDPCEVYLSNYKLVDGRMIPHTLDVWRGDERFATITVKSAQLAAAK